MSSRVRIKNWKKYNPRDDVKTITWFRFDNRFWVDPEIFDLTNDQKMVWIGLLCEASRRHGEAVISTYHLAAVLRMDREVVRQTILMFAEMDMCEVYDDDAERYPSELVEEPRTDPAGQLEEPRTDPCLQDKTGQDRTDNSIVDPKGSTPAFGPDQLVDIWNEHCDPLPRVQKLSTKRRRSAKARCRDDPDPEHWRAVIKRMAKSPFCRGEISDWRADFDFLIKPDTCVKVLEGKYDAREGSRRSQPDDEPPLIRGTIGGDDFGP